MRFIVFVAALGLDAVFFILFFWYVWFSKGTDEKLAFIEMPAAGAENVCFKIQIPFIFLNFGHSDTKN